jgi:hypothetical protein
MKAEKVDFSSKLISMLIKKFVLTHSKSYGKSSAHPLSKCLHYAKVYLWLFDHFKGRGSASKFKIFYLNHVTVGPLGEAASRHCYAMVFGFDAITYVHIYANVSVMENNLSPYFKITLVLLGRMVLILL